MAVRSLKDGQLYRGGITSLKNKTKSNKLTAPGDVDPGAFIPIATTTLSTATATITFSGIPQNYEHLQLRILFRSIRAANSDDPRMAFNSDTAANYSYHNLFADGSTVAAYNGVSTGAQIVLPPMPAASRAASAFGLSVVDILDYTNTSKYKTVRALGGYDDNGQGYTVFVSGLWNNTAAINTITLTSLQSSSYAQYSSFTLYGIKRAGA
jgi:hypothetical protein